MSINGWLGIGTTSNNLRVVAPWVVIVSCVFGIIVSNNTYELEENSAQLLIDSVISFMRQRHNHKLTLNLTNILKPIDKRIKRENK